MFMKIVIMMVSSDLPVDLFVSGSHNQNDVTISSIPQNNYYLAGNPYIKTISWNDISKTNLSSVVSVWDDAASDWKTHIRYILVI